jgi:hypothetical protein
MNRNFFIADPDAFTVSTQTVDDQSWHNGPKPLTIDEAKVSIALAAVAGGMFELGDDLPTLGSTPERLALVKNARLLEMARLGHASTPIDLMTYSAADAQPSIFLLKEDKRQSILTVFNWTDGELKRTLRFGDLGLKDPQKYQITEVFGEKNCCTASGDAIQFVQPPHSVRMYQLVEEGIQPLPLTFEISSAKGNTGDELTFNVVSTAGGASLLDCRWEFGDGVSGEGLTIRHAYTQPGEYTVQATVIGLGGGTSSKTATVKVTGNLATKFVPAEKKRPE